MQNHILKIFWGNDDYFVLKATIYCTEPIKITNFINKRKIGLVTMKIFKAEQWNIEVLCSTLEAYRLANGMSENPDRTLTFLTNRMRFNESMFLLL